MKALTLLVAALAVVSLSACANNQPQTDTAGSATSADQVFADKNTK